MTEPSEPRKARLTDKYLKALEPEAQRFTVWDEEIPGFGIRVSPEGRKSWVFQYRVRRAGQGKLTFGVWPEVPAAGARQKASVYRALVTQGQDPAVERRASFTVTELARVFRETYAPSRLKPATLRSYGICLDQHILPKFGKRTVAALSHPEVSTWHAKLGIKTPRTANLCLAVLSRMMTLAAKWGHRKDPNPCVGIEPHKIKAKARFLTREEAKDLVAAIVTSEANPYMVAAYLLILATGCRRDEIRTLRWDHVHTEARLLRLPDSKTGAKAIPLNALALRILAGIPKKDGNPYVIAGEDGQPIVNLNKTWNRIRKKAGLPGVRIHDLRHTFASLGLTYAQVPLEGMRDLLGHSTVKTTEIYGHLIVADPVAEASERIGSLLETGIWGAASSE